MKTESTKGLAAPDRVIPQPPGGGSWKFDEARWEWIDNNPQPEAATQLTQE